MQQQSFRRKEKKDNMATENIQTVTINTDELVQVLEPLMRRIVREELAEFAAQETDFFRLEPGSPLYESLVNILQRKEEGKLKFYSHEEVFGE
jgi:hypothetical protein